MYLIIEGLVNTGKGLEPFYLIGDKKGMSHLEYKGILTNARKITGAGMLDISKSGWGVPYGGTSTLRDIRLDVAPADFNQFLKENDFYQYIDPNTDKIFYISNLRALGKVSNMVGPSIGIKIDLKELRQRIFEELEE